MSQKPPPKKVKRTLVKLPGTFFLYPSPVLRDKGGVQARFLLGPAGTGKTFLCLEEIRQALLNDPQEELPAAPVWTPSRLNR